MAAFHQSCNCKFDEKGHHSPEGDPRPNGDSRVNQEQQLDLHRRLLPEGAPHSFRPSLACLYTLTHSLMWLTTDMSAAVSHTVDMSVVAHSRHVCPLTQQTCRVCHAADVSAV